MTTRVGSNYQTQLTALLKVAKIRSNGQLSLPLIACSLRSAAIVVSRIPNCTGDTVKSRIKCLVCRETVKLSYETLLTHSVNFEITQETVGPLVKFGFDIPSARGRA